MKLYLFGPMRGYPDNNSEAFKDARERLRDMGHEIFCPDEINNTLLLGTELSIRECMRYDVAWILDHAEGLVGLPGWTKSKGSLAEVHLAWAIGLPVYEYNLLVRHVIREVKNVTES